MNGPAGTTPASTDHEIPGPLRATTREAQGRLFFAWLFTLPIMLIILGSWAFRYPWPTPALHALLMLVLAFPVVFVVGGDTLLHALAGLRRHRPGPDVLVGIGTLAAYGTGILALLLPITSFAGVAAVLMAFHMTGRYLETGALRRVAASMRPLGEPGVARSATRHDEATGGPERGSSGRAAARMVSAVLMLAALTFTAWLVLPHGMSGIAQGLGATRAWPAADLGGVSLAMFAALAVLVVASPGALDLAASTALKVGRGRAAEAGVLFRTGAALMSLAKADTVVLSRAGVPPAGQQAVTGALRHFGLALLVLTGEGSEKAARVATTGSTDERGARLSPADQLDRIRQLQRQGHRVVVVGDAIQDAPLFAQADVAIALGDGQLSPAEGADIALGVGDADGIVAAVRWARATRGTVRQSLVWVFLYHLVAIPLAMLGLLHPVLAQVAMTGASLIVVGNALRLQRDPF